MSTELPPPPSPPPAWTPAPGPQRLAPAVVLVEAATWVRRGGIPAVLLLLSRPIGVVLATAAVVAAVGLPLLVLAWRRWTYVVDGDRLEVRRGVVQRSVRVVRLDRVRGVEVNAPPLQRLLGLVEVRVEVAAGGPDGGDVRLPAVLAAEGDRLRVELLRRAAPVGGEETAAGTSTPSGVVLHRTRTGLLLAGGATSLRFVVAPLALGAAALQVVDDLGALDPRDVLDAVDGAPPPALVVGGLVVAVAATLVALGAVGQLIVDGRFTLTDRAGEGRLVSERGLLTKRVVGLDRERVRGVDVTEGLLRRPFGLIHVDAVVAGAMGGEVGSTTLVPVAPAGEAWAVAGAVLGELPAAGVVRPAPAAALPRRLARAVALPALATVAATAVGSPALALLGAAATVVGVPLAWDRWRRLGQGVDGRWLVVVEGSVLHRRSVVAVDAAVAVRITSSPAQRRAGLCTLHLDLGGGAGSRRALDLTPADAVELASAVAPTLVRPASA